MIVDKSGKRVRTMFGQIAPKYDRMNHLLSMNTDRYWRWKTVRLVRPSGNAPILDVCTGTGDLAIAFHRAAGGQATVVGTDFCREMLAIANAKKQQVSRGREIQFLEADTQHLPFANDHFQIVCVAFGLRNVADMDRGLAEMTRVCRPGGKVVILEFSLPTWQPFRGAYGWYFHNVLPRIGQWMARNDQSAYEYLPASVGEFPSAPALADRMREAGLATVQFTPLTLGVATLHVGEK